MEDVKVVHNRKQGLEMDIRQTFAITDVKDKMDFRGLSCLRCNEKFSEDRVPRNLPCGHCVCSVCAVQTSPGRMVCPECREINYVNNIADLRINYPLVRLLRDTAFIKAAESCDTVMTLTVFDCAPSAIPLENIQKCGSHGRPLLLLCCSCSKWICEDCLIVDHPSLPRGTCVVLGYSDAMTRVKIECDKVSQSILGDLESVKRTIAFKLSMHELCLRHCPLDKRSHIRVTQDIENQLQELSKNNNESKVDLMIEKRKRISDRACNCALPEDITICCDELLRCQKDLPELTEEEIKVYEPVVDTMVEHFRMDLRILTKGKEPVYAVLENVKGIRWTRVTIEETRLLLYSLQEGKPPKDGISIPFEYAKMLSPNNNRTVFFEIGTEEEVLGTVYVRLFKDSPLTQQTALLCTGEYGVCYKNTCFYKFKEKETVLFGGDYKNNDGTGGRAIVSGLAESYAESWTECPRGALASDRVSARLQFHFGKRTFKQLVQNIIGEVMYGLPVLQKASKVEPLSKVVIKECGLFLPMNPK